jgi:predicted MFS family arabinose efflux permease
MATITRHPPIHLTAPRRPSGMAQVVLYQALTSTSQFALILACQTWAIYQGGQHASYLALLSACYAAPMALNRLLGRLVDRIGPRRVGVAAHLTGAGVLLISLLWAPTPAAVLITATLSSAIRIAAQASADTLPTWLPERPPVSAASVWITLAQAAPMIVGSTAAVALTTTAGLRGALAVLAAGSLAAVATLTRTPSRRPTATATTPDPHHPKRRIWTIYAVTFASYGVIELAQPLYLRDVAHAPAWLLAAANGSFSAAACLGAVLLHKHHHLLQRKAALPIGIAAVAAGEVLIVATHSAAIAILGNIAWGAAVSLLAPATRTRMLNRVPPDQHGATLGTMRTIRAGATFAATAACGPLATTCGVQITTLLAATLLAASLPLTRKA